VTTIGAVFDILPAAIFSRLPRVPDGRLRSRFERALVIARTSPPSGCSSEDADRAFPNPPGRDRAARPSGDLEKVQLLSLRRDSA
jgi:hypothetical protein